MGQDVPESNTKLLTSKMGEGMAQQQHGKEKWKFQYYLNTSATGMEFEPSQHGQKWCRQNMTLSPGPLPLHLAATSPSSPPFLHV